MAHHVGKELNACWNANPDPHCALESQRGPRAGTRASHRECDLT